MASKLANHSSWLWWLPFSWFLMLLLSLLKAWNKSIPRPILRMFIPTIPDRASGNSTPFPNLCASLISLTVMRMWGMHLANTNAIQFSTHSNFTSAVLLSRIPAILLSFLTCRKIECICLHIGVTNVTLVCGGENLVYIKLDCYTWN